MKKFLFGLSLTVLLLSPVFAEAANTAPEITKHPEDVSASSGIVIETVTFSVEATGSEPLTYQWQWNYALFSDSKFIDVPGANSADFSFIADWGNGGEYRVVVSNAYGSVTSNIAYLSVASFTPGPPPKITIDTQPASRTEVTEGSITGILSVEASTDPFATLTYQWYSYRIGKYADGAPIPGATSASFTIPETLKASDSPYYYYCNVKGSAFGRFPGDVDTEAAAVTVTPTGIIPTGTEPTTTTITPTGSEPATTTTNPASSGGGGCNSVMIGNGMFAALLTLLAGRKKDNG